MSHLYLAFLKTVKIKLFSLQLVKYIRKHVISSSCSRQMKARIYKPNVFSNRCWVCEVVLGLLPCTGLHCMCQCYQGRPARSSTQNQSPAIKPLLHWAIEAAALDRLLCCYRLNAQLVLEPWDVCLQCVVWVSFLAERIAVDMLWQPHICDLLCIVEQWRNSLQKHHLVRITSLLQV